MFSMVYIRSTSTRCQQLPTFYKTRYRYKSATRHWQMVISICRYSPSPPSLRACRNSWARCPWWGHTAGSSWTLNSATFVFCLNFVKYRRREDASWEWRCRWRQGRAPRSTSRRRRSCPPWPPPIRGEHGVDQSQLTWPPPGPTPRWPRSCSGRWCYPWSAGSATIQYNTQHNTDWKRYKK